MKTFTDAAGRTWTINLTLGTAMAVKDKLDIDLLQPEAGDPPLLTRLGTDEILLGEVLCALLEDQFEAHKVTAADVRNAFDGQTILAAQKAFYEELVDFFQSRGRADRAKAVATQMKMIDAAVTAIETRIDNLDVDAIVSGAMSGELPEASASTREN
ncbi:MAG: hypothetical protein K8S55_01275 [Phycisphaerae bacterium]|nr:hypothetical protein [Phycisphaerae bacterium]